MLPVINRNNWMPEVFNDFFDTDFMTRANATAPAINVKETDKDYTVEVAAPGMTRMTSMSTSIRTVTYTFTWRLTPKRKMKTRRVIICAASLLTASLSRLCSFLKTLRKRLSRLKSMMVCLQ